MTSLDDALRRLRSILEADPDGILAGSIREPCRADLTSLRLHWRSYADFLERTDGATFGSVDFWSWNDLPNKQYPAIDFPGGPQRWLVVGQILYEPCALDAESGELRLFRRYGEPEGQSLGGLSSFVGRLLSRDYASVVIEGEHDEWWRALERAGLL
jgi:hypothetical protein